MNQHEVESGVLEQTESNEEETIDTTPSKVLRNFSSSEQIEDYSSITPIGNKIEFIDWIGNDEESLENMIDYHGNPEDIEKFMNWNINFAFPDDEFDQMMNQELDKLRIDGSQDGIDIDDEQLKENNCEIDTQSTRDQTIVDIDIFSQKKISFKRSFKKQKMIPEIFKKMKLPTNDRDIYFCDISEFPNVQKSHKYLNFK